MSSYGMPIARWQVDEVVYVLGRDPGQQEWIEGYKQRGYTKFDDLGNQQTDPVDGKRGRVWQMWKPLPIE